MIKKLIFTLSLVFIAIHMYSKDYDASLFGIESNGITLNTNSIQKAIDYIHEEGGGRLIFHVGKYITGTVYLKSNVTIHLKEGAVLMGSLNPFDYDFREEWTAMIFAINQDSIAITGTGIIDGRGYGVSQKMISLIQKGVIKDDRFSNDRPYARIRPQNIYFKGCNEIKIQGIQINNPASWNQQYDQCRNLLIDGIKVDSKNYWNNDGMDIVDCDSVIIRNCFIDASDDGICLKSHHPHFLCKNILIYNNTIRSSASAIKFGTYTFGGFKDIRIIKNTVYDTYRSAITFQSMDGGGVENVIVDSLKAINTGNIIFLRLGERTKGRIGKMKNISMSNIYAEVPATKPDKGYLYEGPVEHLPRNISPSLIVGLPHVAIENISIKNVEIHYPGGADTNYAKISLEELDNIPELPSNYPEFSMFKELPAWGFYIRHVKGLTFENVRLTCKGKDYRVAVLLDDVHNAKFKGLKITESEKVKSKIKNNIFQHNSSDVKMD